MPEKRSHHNASEFWENTPALHKETRHKVGTDICPSDSSTLYFELTKFHAFTLHSCSVISLTNPVNINSKKPVRLKKEGVVRSQLSPEDKHTHRLTRYRQYLLHSIAGNHENSLSYIWEPLMSNCVPVHPVVLPKIMNSVREHHIRSN